MDCDPEAGRGEGGGICSTGAGGGATFGGIAKSSSSRMPALMGRAAHKNTTDKMKAKRFFMNKKK